MGVCSAHIRDCRKADVAGLVSVKPEKQLWATVMQDLV